MDPSMYMPLSIGLGAVAGILGLLALLIGIMSGSRVDTLARSVSEIHRRYDVDRNTDDRIAEKLAAEKLAALSTTSLVDDRHRRHDDRHYVNDQIQSYGRHEGTDDRIAELFRRFERLEANQGRG